MMSLLERFEGLLDGVRGITRAFFPRVSSLFLSPEVEGECPEDPARPLESNVVALGRVVEAIARQRALAEQRLKRGLRSGTNRDLEVGRRMGCIEIAKELGVHEDVAFRTYELQKRS